MCGRATLAASGEDLRELFHLDTAPELPPRYNIAPTQPIAVIRTPGKLELLRWGLVPSWAEDVAAGNRFINARMETAPRAPAFRDAFRGRRCLVVVDGFYEWQGKGKARRPFHVRRPDGKPFALAGLWERWVSRDGEVVESCAVLTGDSSGVVAGLHDRMPVVLPPGAYDAWIDPATPDAAAMMVPSSEGLVAVGVGKHVNDPGHDDPHCLDAWEGPGELFEAKIARPGPRS